jgi:hypothetical protein
MTAAYDETGGAQLENLAACSLLKYAQFRKDAYGENWEIFYLRDKESREVDFVAGEIRNQDLAAGHMARRIAIPD